MTFSITKKSGLIWIELKNKIYKKSRILISGYRIIRFRSGQFRPD